MELSGRTYIFFAAALVTLGGAVEHYEAQQDESLNPSMVITQSAASQECDNNALDFGEFRVGCQKENRDVRVLNHTPTRVGLNTPQGGMKFVSASRD